MASNKTLRQSLKGTTSVTKVRGCGKEEHGEGKRRPLACTRPQSCIFSFNTSRCDSREPQDSVSHRTTLAALFLLVNGGKHSPAPSTFHRNVCRSDKCHLWTRVELGSLRTAPKIIQYTGTLGVSVTEKS